MTELNNKYEIALKDLLIYAEEQATKYKNAHNERCKEGDPFKDISTARLSAHCNAKREAYQDIVALIRGEINEIEGEYTPPL